MYDDDEQQTGRRRRGNFGTHLQYALIPLFTVLLFWWDAYLSTSVMYYSYKSNLEQIRNAVLETVYIGVLEAFLRCKTVSQVWTAKYGAQASASRVRTAMAQEVEDWACVQVGLPTSLHMQEPHDWHPATAICLLPSQSIGCMLHR